MTTHEIVSYQGWPTCARLSNGSIELIITGDVGPRIIRFGFLNSHNEFAEYAGQVGKTGGDEWRIYGGHRLWHAPEAKPRTYFPDNHPVKFEQHAGFLRVIQPVEPTTGIQKEIDIALAPDAAHVHLTHRLRNLGVWPVELAVWALSVMAPGGTAIIPMPPRGSHNDHLLPANSLALWPYTNMSDARWTWGEKYILLRQDPNASNPQKTGAAVPDGWVAYARSNHLFVKRFTHMRGATYPDFGSSVETFTNSDMLEVETLSPLTALAPGQAVEHVENWHLFDGVPMPGSDADVERDVLPRAVAAIQTA